MTPADTRRACWCRTHRNYWTPGESRLSSGRNWTCRAGLGSLLRGLAAALGLLSLSCKRDVEDRGSVPKTHGSFCWASSVVSLLFCETVLISTCWYRSTTDDQYVGVIQHGDLPSTVSINVTIIAFVVVYFFLFILFYLKRFLSNKEFECLVKC